MILRSVSLIVLMAASGNAFAAPLPEVCDASPFLKTPWLLFNGTAAEMTVIWQMDDSLQCFIEWGNDTTYSSGSASTTEFADDHRHSFVIDSLDPESQYYYSVSCSGTSLPGSFRSAPLATDSTLSLMAYGDTRSNYMVHDSVSGAMMDIYELHPRYQTLLLHSGDIIEFGAEEDSWQQELFNDAQTRLRQRMQEVPLTACLGNHELYLDDYADIDLDTPLFGKYFPHPYVDRRYWSFDYGPVHITIVDQYPSNFDPYGQGLLSPEEVSWIEGDLASSSSPWKIVLLHEPGWSAGGTGHVYNNDDVQNLLQPLCELYGVQLVLGGHNHYYLRACRNAVHHVTTGGGGAPLRTPHPDFPNVITAIRDHHFCLLDFEGDSLTVTVVGLEGDTLDIFWIPGNMQISHLLGSVSLNGGTGSVEEVLITTGVESVNPCIFGYYGMVLDPGTYNITASLDGYEPQTFEDIEIISGTETTLDIEMYLTSIESGSTWFDSHLRSPEPNPFTSLTMIHFSTGEIGQVNLRLFDLSGRLIRELCSGELTRGAHTVQMDASDIDPGLYFVVLETGSDVLIERCMKL